MAYKLLKLQSKPYAPKLSKRTERRHMGRNTLLFTVAWINRIQTTELHQQNYNVYKIQLPFILGYKSTSWISWGQVVSHAMILG